MAFLLAASFPAQAQTATAPPLSTTTTSLYAHRATSGSDETVGWMNSLVDDGDDNAMGPSASCGPQGAGQVGVAQVDDQFTTVAIDRTYTITLDPALAGSLTLDTAKPVQATIFFGAGSCQGNVHIASTLMAAGDSIATGEKDHTYKAGAPYPSVAIDMPVTQATVAGKLDWVIHVTGKTEGAGYMGISAAQGHTVLALPILAVSGGGLPPVYSTITTNGFAASGHHLNATTQAHHYNWTQGPAKALFVVDAHVLAGNLTVSIRDAANATLLTSRITANGTANQTLTGSAGTWTLWINATAFKGDYAISLVPLPANGTTPTSSPHAATGASGTTASKVTNPSSTTGTSKGTPWLSMAGSLAVLGAVALCRKKDG